MSAASVLIDQLKALADKQIIHADVQQGNVNAAVYAGHPELALTAFAKPADVTSSKVFTGWTTPALPVLPALPAIPDNLKIDSGKLSTLSAGAIAAISNSWVAKFFPTDIDMSSLNALYDPILNGKTQIAAEAKLNALEAAVLAALKTVTDKAQTDINTRITKLSDSLSPDGANSMFTQAKTGIASGLAIASDGTQNIAWVKARDQVAREAARAERETISKWASRGFALPSGALNAQISRSRQATLDAALGIAADQAVKTQQLFFDTAKLSVSSYLTLLTEQTQSAIEEYKSRAAMDLRNAELVVDASKFNAKLAFDHLGLTLDFTKFAATTAVTYRLGIINAMSGLITAYTAIGRNEADYLATISKAQVAAQQAIVEYYRAAVQFSEVGMKAELANQDAALRFVQIASQFVSGSVSDNVKAQVARLDGYTRIAGMALSGLNGVASVTEQLSS